MSSSSSSASEPELEKGSLLNGRPAVLPKEALGSSKGSSKSSGSRSNGRLALFPVGTILTLVLVLEPVLDGDTVGENRPLVPEKADSESSPGPIGILSSSSSGVFPLTASCFPGKSSGTIGLPLTREITGGGVASSSGMNSIGVKFSVLKGRLVGRTLTTRTPVGPSLVWSSLSALLSVT